MKKLLLLIVILVVTLTLVGCASAADKVSHNLSVEADEFRIKRRIIFINLITGEYLFEMEGNCSIEKDVEQQQLEVTCMIGDGTYAKHFLDVHDGANVTYIVEQLEYQYVSRYDYHIKFKPEAIIPITIETVTEGN